eukprot:3872453-Alexandrium_andersonii.AAC.1
MGRQDQSCPYQGQEVGQSRRCTRQGPGTGPSQEGALDSPGKQYGCQEYCSFDAGRRGADVAHLVA